MIFRSSLKTGTVPTAATGILLLALAAASLGCAFAACYGVADAVPRQPAAAPAPPMPRAAMRAVDPTAGVAGRGRCAGVLRARRVGCRAADLPAV